MRVRIHGSDEIVPVFGTLRGGLLISGPDRAELRPVAAEYEIVDARPSALWSERDGERAFAEFFEAYFAENLASGAPREKFVVQSYFELFDREFPRNDLELPKYYGDGLVMCPRCGRISRPLSFLGVIRCNDLKCRLEMNNPFYDPEQLEDSIEWGRLSYLSECREQYYCAKMDRYYPAPPSILKVFGERLSEGFREWRQRHRPRRGQEK